MNKNEYKDLVFSKELCQLLMPEIKLKSEIERIKKMTALLQQSTEKLHLALLREHGLSERVSEDGKKEYRKEEKDQEQEADLTLTFAASAISEVATQHRSAWKPADRPINHSVGWLFNGSDSTYFFRHVGEEN